LRFKLLGCVALPTFVKPSVSRSGDDDDDVEVVLLGRARLPFPRPRGQRALAASGLVLTPRPAEQPKPLLPMRPAHPEKVV